MSPWFSRASPAARRGAPRALIRVPPQAVARPVPASVFDHSLEIIEGDEDAVGGAERGEGVPSPGDAQAEALARRATHRLDERLLACRGDEPLRMGG